MKKTFLLSFALACALLLAACAPKPETPSPADAAPTQAAGLQDVSGLLPISDAQQYVNPLPTEPPEMYDGPPSMLDPSAAHYLDVKDFTVLPVPQQDLSMMSATVAYAQLYNIFMNQEQYVGQTIKLRGQYTPMRDENGASKFHFIMVYDNAACCQLGLEFIWTNPAAYPADYSLIELTGVFDICNDAGEKFCVLRVKDLTVLQEAPAA